MMTSRERLRRAYFHEEMDRPAIYSRPGYPENDDTYDELKAYLAEYAELKTAWGVETTPYPVTTFPEPYSDTFERHVSVLHTPKGDLRATRLESLTGQAGLHETFYINDRDDAEKYLSLPLPEIVGDASVFFEKDRQIGDRGIAEVALGHNPAAIIANLCGSENFAMMTITDRDILHILCEREMGIQLAKVDFALAQGTGPYFRSAGQEFLVPPLHGPADFRDFNVKYDKPIFDRIHDAGGRVHVHSHGSIAKVIDGFLAVGVDVLHPFEAPPMGDITAAEAQRAIGMRMTMEGNLQINRLYEVTPEEIREETEALIRDVFERGSNLIVCPTASPYIRGRGVESFPQYKAMIDAVIGWKAG